MNATSKLVVLLFFSVLSATSAADEPGNALHCPPGPDKKITTPALPRKPAERVQEINVYSGWLYRLLEGLVKLFSSLAWPIAAVVIADQLRSEIAALLSRLKCGKWGSAEVEFFDSLRTAEEEIEIPTTPEAQAVDPSTVERATRDPRGTILSAWLEVESALN